VGGRGAAENGQAEALCLWLSLSAWWAWWAWWAIPLITMLLRHFDVTEHCAYILLLGAEFTGVELSLWL